MGVLIKTLFKEANHLTRQSYKNVSTKENIEQNFKNVHKLSYVLCTIQSSVVRHLSDVNTEI